VTAAVARDAPHGGVDEAASTGCRFLSPSSSSTGGPAGLEASPPPSRRTEACGSGGALPPSIGFIVRTPSGRRATPVRRISAWHVPAPTSQGELPLIHRRTGGSVIVTD
jgi:hypothetical protein